jgi:hypothetical protein
MTLLPRSGRPLNNEAGTLFPAWNGPQFTAKLWLSFSSIDGTRNISKILDRHSEEMGTVSRYAEELKTYQTSQGFYDLAIAAPSIKAALEAWGASSNLFHQGFEEGR